MTGAASWGATARGGVLHKVIPLNGARWSLCGLKREAWFTPEEVAPLRRLCSRCVSIRGPRLAPPSGALARDGPPPAA